MRTPVLRTLSLLFGLAALGSGTTPGAAPAAEPDLSGSWKLSVVRPFAQEDLMIVDFQKHGASPEGMVRDSPFAQPPKITRVETKGGSLTLGVSILGTETVFQGKPDAKGAFVGRLQIRNRSLLARLEKTTSAKVTPPSQTEPESYKAFAQAMNTRDLKDRYHQLQAIVARSPGDASLSVVYAALLKEGGAGGASKAEAEKTLSEWLHGAEPYGADAVAETQAQALGALKGQKAFADLGLALARRADAEAKPDAPLEARARIAASLAGFAELTGDAGLAKTARDKASKLDAEIDAEYRKTVPPFAPDATAGDRAPKSDRVVLLELFTGAECPPCVAADVGFDALLSSYKPSQLAGLQYHLHIPGPDPLTNNDSSTRSEYYPDLQGTPGVFFDGQSRAAGGGPLAFSKSKYDEFRQIVDEQLARPSDATITLKAERAGDVIRISAGAEAKPERKAKDAAKIGGSKLRLRLALVEDEVKYVGGNALRFHHHVVRATPGGASGKAFTGGKAALEASVNVAELRKELETYLSDYAKQSGGFSRELPPVALAKLSVVAYVQDESDKSVLNAAVARVEGP